MTPLLSIIDVRLGAISMTPPGYSTLVLTRDGFIYKGELVEDAGKAHALFFETMTLINAHEQRVHFVLSEHARRWDWLMGHMVRAQVDGHPTWVLSADEVDDATLGALFSECIDELIEAEERAAEDTGNG